MENSSTYVSVLKNTLIRKYDALIHLEKIMIKLEDVLSTKNVNVEFLDKNLSDRDDLIKQIETLDKGFESIYDKVSVEIKKNREKYTTDINIMQSYIPKITEVGVRISAIEMRCKTQLGTFFNGKRKEVKNFKISSRTASNYYKNMYNGYNNETMHIMDKKK